MGEQKVKIYIASSVGIDYFFFLGKTIENAGYDVESIFLVSEVKYRELGKTTGWKKIWLRMQMYFFYPWYLVFKGIMSSNNSIFVISSNTFFAPFILKAVVGWKGGKVIHMLYDLYPDAIEIAGIIGVNSFKAEMIGKIAKLNQRKCDATVYLGEFLREHAERRWGKTRLSDVIDISTDLSLYSTDLKEAIAYDKLIVHYGGQLGHLHDALSIIESIKYVCTSDIANRIEFNFYVSGAQAQLLQAALKDFPVKIIAAVPSHKWRQDISAFHIGLVSLSPGGASVCLPSKTYAMMAGGMAMIGICPVWSDLASLIKRLDAGWIINNSLHNEVASLSNGNYLENLKRSRNESQVALEFYQCLKFLLKSKESLIEKRRNAFYGVRQRYNVTELSRKWKKIIENAG